MSSTRNRFPIVLFAIWLLATCVVGAKLVADRPYTVDEFHTVFEIHLLTIDQPEDFTQTIKVYRIPLSWLTAQFDNSADILLSLRVVFFVLFLSNCILIAFAQPYFRTWWGRLGVLITATTVYPLWVWGTEMRHDNVFLLMQPVLYWVTQRYVRTRCIEPCLLITAGLACAWMVLASPKSAVIWLPWAVAFVVLAPFIAKRRPDCTRRRAMMWWATGVAIGLLSAVILLLATGFFRGFLESFGMTYAMYGSASRFSAWPAINESIRAAPHIWVLGVVAIYLRGADAIRLRQWPPLASLVTLGFVAWNVAVLFINPNPYAYNVIQLMSVAVFLAVDGVARILEEPAAKRREATIAIVIWILLLGWMPWRCDVPLLAGQLILFVGTLRVIENHAQARGWIVSAGACCMLLQILVFQSTIYWLPYAVLLLGILVFRSRKSIATNILKSLRPFFIGLLAAVSVMPILVLGRLIYGYLFEDWPVTIFDWFYYAPFRPFASWPAAVFSLLGLAAAWYVLRNVPESGHRRNARIALAAFYLAWGLAACQLEWSVVHFESLNIIVFGFIVLCSVSSALFRNVPWTISTDIGIFLAIAIVVVVRAGVSDSRNWTGNETQIAYIRAAEALTDPVADTVLDGVGFVATRRPPTRDWYLQQLLLRDYRSGNRAQFDKILVSNPSPVVITSYRWTWLGDSARKLLQERYARIDADFYVLGGELTVGRDVFEIFKTGRYRFETSSVTATANLIIDGHSIDRDHAVVLLNRGPHRVSRRGDEIVRYYWVGPHLDELPTITPPLKDKQPIVLP